MLDLYTIVIKVFNSIFYHWYHSFALTCKYTGYLKQNPHRTKVRYLSPTSLYYIR